MTDLIWSFAPWLVFLLASRVTSLYGAAAAGAIAALIVLISAIRRQHVHMPDVASTGYFAALGATLIVVHPGHLDYWARYAQAGSHLGSVRGGTGGCRSRCCCSAALLPPVMRRAARRQ